MPTLQSSIDTHDLDDVAARMVPTQQAGATMSHPSQPGEGTMSTERRSGLTDRVRDVDSRVRDVDQPVAYARAVLMHECVSRHRRRSASEVLRETDGRFSVALSRQLQPGNWLKLPAGGRFSMTLRLYDTPAALGAGAVDPRSLPAIERMECGA